MLHFVSVVKVVLIISNQFYIEKEINFWQNNMNSYYFSLFDETFFTSLL
jgi:hypothetical protein